MGEEAATPQAADVVVVGGGIAGLAAAYTLRDLDVVVLEASDRVGGRIRSEPRDPYWLNLAAHVFPGPGSALHRLLGELGLRTERIPGSTTNAWLDGRLVQAESPWQLLTRLPLDVRGRASLTLAGARIRRAVGEYQRLARERSGEPASARRARLLAYRDDETFAQYVGRRQAPVQALLKAAINRVSAEPEELAAGAGAAQFAATFSGRSSQFHYVLPGGSSRLVRQLERHLDGRIHVRAQVHRVTNVDDGVEITLGELGERLLARAAIVATPANVTRHLLADAPVALSAALGSITYGPYVVGAVLTDESERMPWDDMYAIVVADKSFNMLFNTVNVLRQHGPRLPGGSLTMYGAASLARSLLDLDDSEVERRFRSDLADVLPETSGRVGEIVIQRWETGIPFSTPGRHRHQPVLEAPWGHVYLTGDYIGQRAGLDTATEIALEVAKEVRRDVMSPSRSFARVARERPSRRDAGVGALSNSAKGRVG
jgi:oxygen-dependent protoporphyrinogen oxidase